MAKDIAKVIKKGAKGGQQYSEEKLRAYGAIPNDLVLDKLGWRDKVKAIFISVVLGKFRGPVRHEI